MHEFLKTLPLFATLAPSDLARLAQEVEVVQWPAGAQLLAEGYPGECAYLVYSGEVAICIATDAGEILVATRSTGDLIGEIALLDDGPHTASVWARTAVILLRLTHAQFEQLFVNHPTFARLNGVGLGDQSQAGAAIGRGFDRDQHVGRGVYFYVGTAVALWRGGRSHRSSVRSHQSAIRSPSYSVEPFRCKASDARPRTLDSGLKTVLAIDDDPDVIYMLRENLAEAGYQVVGASNGEEGVQQAKALRPFAITLDIMMPHKDGWQVLHELKRDPLTRNIPVILLTIVDKKTLGYQLGAADYLVKPFDQATLLAALNALATPSPWLDDHPLSTRLLVVDDDPDVIDLARQWLTAPDYVVEAVADGMAALEAVGRQPPDVILLDLLMPRLDGFEVIERLRQDPATRDLPIIVLTAKTLEAAENAWLHTRVAQVIQKQGFASETLLIELRRVLQTHQAKERAKGRKPQ